MGWCDDEGVGEVAITLVSLDGTGVAGDLSNARHVQDVFPCHFNGDPDVLPVDVVVFQSALWVQ